MAFNNEAGQSNAMAGQSNGKMDLAVASNINIIDELNNLGKVKSWIKASEMEIGKLYRILGFSQSPSKFDPSRIKTIVELEMGYLSLPARFDNMDPNTFELLCLKQDLAIINQGAVGKTYKLEFKSINIMDFYNSIQTIIN